MRRPLVLLACLALLAACSEQPPERADTVKGAAPAGTTATAAATSAPTARQGTGAALTQQEAEAALLTTAHLPTGWSVEPGTTAADEPPPTEPSHCRDTLQISGAKPLADARATYTAGPAGPTVSHRVASFKASGADRIERIKAAVDRCRAFTIDPGSEEPVEVAVSPLSFPNLGDRTLAFRVSGNSGQHELILDFVEVASGQNIVVMTTAGLLPMEGKELERLVVQAVDQMGRVSSGAD